MKTTYYGPYGLFLRLFPCIPSLFPGLIALQWNTWPFLVLWTAGVVFRSHYHDSSVVQDSLIFGIINAFLLRDKFLDLPNTTWKEMVSVNWTPTSSTLIRALVLVLLLGGLGFWFRQYRTSMRNRSSEFTFPADFAEYVHPDHPKALIFPCRTTHARVFPKKHAFIYSYLLYGIPIFPKVISPDGSRYGVLNDSKKGNWWLHVRAQDYLERGYGELGFYEKLKLALKAEGVEESEWLYAYLLTAPRFFGYSFNPVSFWYIYNKKHELRKMILEVNNTFGERRLYVLHGSGSVESTESSSSEMTVIEKIDSPRERFVDSWQKDFHVSPFNSRKGGYSLKASNPFPNTKCKSVEVDNTIILTSSKAHAKIVARVHSTGPPLDPANLGIMGTLRFIGGWFWVGFLTSPRILKEAYKLYVKRSLNVWLRPEVLASSIGRAPTSIEIALEKVFVSYLRNLVDRSTEQFNITLHTSIPQRPKEFIATTHIQGREIKARTFDIKVLSPSFYTRFVHYAHASEAFDRECLFTNNKNRTLEVSHPEFLCLMLPNAKSKSEDMYGEIYGSYFDEKRWSLLRYLRCPPAEPAYPDTHNFPNTKVSDIRALPFSDLDNFMRKPYNILDAGSYRRNVTKVFLAHRFALGFVQVVDTVDLLLRVFLCYFGSRMLASWSYNMGQHGLDRALYFFPNAGFGEMKNAHAEWWWLLKLGFCICVSHFYGLMKGYR